MRLAWDLDDSEFRVLALRAYHFLFKVADEARPLRFETPSDAESRLPECRHSGIWVHDNEIQAPSSVMTEACGCPHDDNRICPVHCRCGQMKF